MKRTMTNDTTKKSWGGQWTEEKLDAFEKYVRAYLTIMNNYRDLYGWKLLYFDGFAGSGDRTQQDKDAEVVSTLELFGSKVPQEELYVYRGAAERVVSIEKADFNSFDGYYFIDKSPANCQALEAKLSAFNTKGKKYFLPIDANQAVSMLANTLTKNRYFKALAFLDPFGMQIDWKSIERLKNLSVDLWILVPTGVIVNRLLERKLDKQKGFAHADKLESFFGMPQNEIQDFFYTETPFQTLFGEEDIELTKAEGSIRRIAELYVSRLKNGVFKYVTEEPLVLYNTHNVPIYHFIFASNNEAGRKIAQEIIKKK